MKQGAAADLLFPTGNFLASEGSQVEQQGSPMGSRNCSYINLRSMCYPFFPLFVEPTSPWIIGPTP